MKYYIIGNVHNNIGFVWIGTELPDDIWKYSRHGSYNSEKSAIIACDNLNDDFI